MSARRGIKAQRARTYLTIERSAALFRRELLPNLGPADPIPAASVVLPALSKVPVVDGRDAYRVEYAARDLPLGVEGQTYFDRKQRAFVIGLADPVFRDLEHSKPRARFTLAHELGHFVLHWRDLMSLLQMPHAQAALLRTAEPVHPNSLDTEWQANIFAGAFLMPACALGSMARHHGELDAREVAGRFGVSSGAARNRIQIYALKQWDLDRA
ncbi:MAG TPA: ImmA/IrrE family metallo-endopeptidase [Myxococcales bacterium]|nr:ImmA/IrrE family metallo-endopeptidase [Myxococcales bacterium]